MDGGGLPPPDGAEVVVAELPPVLPPLLPPGSHWDQYWLTTLQLDPETLFEFF
jgi:hypothetical protein